ncbi:hypothetical protein OTK49_28485 [Vibrio coralliirubri]|uniref:hypothetical protein n=1 Tax=Vibrio coralliirubri TaxID=1516159 RepID=UPI002284B1BC|nr:hypothetical protein [Vibrio coralliirubri]MCY9866482.1 hypothetical protein [Vibrio coralliirubri]
METRHVSLMQTIAANLDNKELSDREFRIFIRNSIKGMKDLEEIVAKYAPTEEGVIFEE